MFRRKLFMLSPIKPKVTEIVVLELILFIVFETRGNIYFLSEHLIFFLSIIDYIYVPLVSYCPFTASKHRYIV